MARELLDAKRALGIGVIFFGYAAIRLLDYMHKQDIFREAWRAWVAENKEEVNALREQLLAEEGL